MRTNTHPQREQRPVFVDVSGRRRRTLRVAGGIVILPTVCYVMVLLIAVFAGPAIQSHSLPQPLLPQPLLPQPLLPRAEAAAFPSGEQRAMNVRWNGLARPPLEAIPTNPATTGAAPSTAGLGKASVLVSVTPPPIRAAKRKPALRPAPPMAAREAAVRSAPARAARRSPASLSTPFRGAKHWRAEADESNDDGGDDTESTQRRKHKRSSAKRSR